MALLSIFSHLCFGFGRKRRRGFWLAALVISSLLTSKSWAQSEFKEYQLKAVFLFNFAQFVEWPAVVFPDEETPLVIGVLGDDPFGPILDETVRGERIGRRTLAILRYRRAEEVGECHILFIGKSESPRLESIVAALAGRSILTVSDADQATQRGVMIRFLTEKKKIRLRINLESATRAGLVISSKLLRATEIVSTGKN
jgi:hypothetical protein